MLPVKDKEKLECKGSKKKEINDVQFNVVNEDAAQNWLIFQGK